MNCDWCGRYIIGNKYWEAPSSYGYKFCSQKCAEEWEYEHGGGRKAEEERRRQQEREAEQDRRLDQARTEREEAQRGLDAEKDHFRPFIEKRVGRPLRLDEIWWNDRDKTWAAKEELLKEARAAIRRLEAETGYKISTLSDIENYSFERGYFTWFVEFRRWGFLIVRSSLPGAGRPGEYGSHYASYSAYETSPQYYGLHWVLPQDFAPYIAIAEWEASRPYSNGRNGIADVSVQGFRFLPELSRVVHMPEVQEALENQYTGPGSIVVSEPQFSAEKQAFYNDGSYSQQTGVFKKKWESVPYHLEVSLSALEICLPVKPIAAKPAPVVDDDDFEEDEDFIENDDDFEEEADDEEIEPAPPPKPAAPPKPKFCTKCGAKLDASVKFCSQCGTKI